ncbi:hypothetical protein HOC80_03175 [archaeon]|jgi:membrane-bound metal-dependent hydrolase YbcI (DUF457 family)|nr:hypothetical protein [archaeon]MBT4417080.1 hypothetical protein [archaeon]
MPNAVTHVLIAIILIDFFRDYVLKKKFFPLYLVLIGGIAGILPDIDVLLIWLFELDVHRLYTHSLIIPLGLLLVGLLFLFYKQKHYMVSKVFFVICAGWFIHILLDGLLNGTVIPFWPLSSFEFGLNLLPGTLFSGTLYAGIDAILLVVWFVHEYFRHNIRDYI